MTVLLRRARPALGTLVGISLLSDDASFAEQLIRELFAEIERLEALLSEFRPDSVVSRLNRAAGQAAVQVPPELMEILQLAERVSRASDGAFDCTWAALASLWDSGDAEFRPPAPGAVASALRLVDYRQLELDPQRGTAFLRRPGMRVGLGGIAKAHVAERAAELAVERGVADVLVDAGGDVVVRGRNANRPWTVGIRHPRRPGAIIATVELRDEAMVTSGDYERAVEIDGERWHHLLDPRTGIPARQSWSATVIAPRGALADALSTALFVSGPRGLDNLNSFTDISALLVSSDGTVRQRSAATARFQLVE